MKKNFAGFLLFAALTSVHASMPDDAVFDDLDGTMESVCKEGPTPKCWMPLYEKLAQLTTPATDRQRESALVDYWMLAKYAYFAGDQKKSQEFFVSALKLAENVKLRDAEPGAAQALIHFDMAELALSMRDYGSALRYADDTMLLESKAHQGKPDPSTALLQAAALIGLGREAEADQILNTLQHTLDFRGAAPWEGFLPLGPYPVNPYQTARRIAAHYVREHRYDDALALIRMLEAERQMTLSDKPVRPVRGGFWADRMTQEDLLEDEADVYVAKGNDDEAERILKILLSAREKTRDWKLRNVLMKLADVEKRKGNGKGVDDYTQRATAIAARPAPRWPDPLKESLGPMTAGDEE